MFSQEEKDLRKSLNKAKTQELQTIYAVSEKFKLLADSLTLNMQKYNSSKDSSYYKVIEDNIKRNQILVNCLSDYCDCLRSTGVKEVFELSNPIEQAKDKVSEEFPEKNIKIYISNSLTITGDRNKFSILFEELIKNSCQYSYKDEIDIKVDISKDRYFWEICYKEVGVSIPEADVNNCFVLFYKGLHGMYRNPEGLGVGLSKCKAIVEAHYGEIEASNSSDGFKVCFYIKK